MYPYYLEAVAYERQKTLRQEAEQLRLIKIAQRPHSNKRQILGIILSRAGTQLVNWGYYLQTPYNSTVEAAVSDTSFSQN